MQYFRVLIPFMLLLGLMVGCNGIGTAEFGAVATGGLGNGEGGAGSEPSSGTASFDGISSIDQKTDTTLRLNWTAHADAVAYNVYNMTSGAPVWLQLVNGQASSSVTLTGLTPNQLYKYRVRAMDSEGVNDSNTNDVSVTTNLAPDIPSGVTLVTTSPGFLSTPTVRISGVKNGDTIKLFTDAICTAEVASGVAAGDTIDLTVDGGSALGAGDHDFYANATNAFATASGCSTATVTYTRTLCPNNYIQVPANAGLGTPDDFCVMKYEAKNDGSNNAVSQVAGTPWVSISQNDSRTRCSNLGAGYGLISNPEWMTIAHNIAGVDANWSGAGGVGDGHLNRGHSDNNPTNACDASVENVQGDCSTLGADFHQKRTHTLSNGEVIWDLAGNVWNWVDWNVTPANKAYVSGDTESVAAWRQFPAIDTNINNGDEMETITWQAPDITWNSTQNIGQYFAGVDTSGGAALRGGGWPDGAVAGAFTLHLSRAATSTGANIGFRCVLRP